MKLSKLIFLFLLSNLSAFCQNKESNGKNCNALKHDTIECNFVMEVNSKYLYYSDEDVIFQNNLIYPDFKNVDVANAENFYKSDSVFIYSWREGISYYLYNPCIDFNSLNEFLSKSDKLFLNKENQKNKKNRFYFLKSTIKNKQNIEYLKFRAKVIVINIGEFNWYIPALYCEQNQLDGNGNKYCKKKFKNTLVLLKILDFKYYKEYSIIK